MRAGDVEGGWVRDSWRARPAAQQPEWPDPVAARTVGAALADRPPLVSPAECDRLRAELHEVAMGRAFLLQGGDCAETFASLTAPQVRDKVRVLLQMALVLMHGASLPVVRVGRIAGQYAKPRTSETETVVGVDGSTVLPSYRGDAVNDIGRTIAARTPDPARMAAAYDHAARTLNLVRTYARGGLADLRHVHAWNAEFVRPRPAGQRYESVAADVERALALVQAYGVDLESAGTPRGTELFASHEALLLEYETALTRYDEDSGALYDLSGHLLWIGDRTRQLDGAHVHLMSQVANPVAVKIGPTATPEDVVALVERLDPDGEPGRLTFVSRMGAGRVHDHLPPLIEKVRATGHHVVWACDPMHGNTVELANGLKTRHFDDVVAEVTEFFEVHRELGTHPGGLHVELTGDDVTECLGGPRELVHADLDTRYETACDPRLNAEQALELAFRVAELLRRAASCR